MSVTRLIPATIATLAAVAVACGSGDRSDEQIMASLPVYPAATLVYTHTDVPDDPRDALTLEYVTDDSLDGVKAFYREELGALGWNPQRAQENSEGFSKGGAEVTLRWYGAAPAGTPSYFGVSVLANEE